MQQDREVAQEQAAQRCLIIERVNKMLFNETDKVKGFHGSVLHCDVLAERAAQIELKGQVQNLHAAQEQAFVQQQKAQLELAEEAALQQLRETKARALEQRDAQLAQLEELKASILSDREQRRIEVSCCLPHVRLHSGMLNCLMCTACLAQCCAQSVHGRSRSACLVCV